MTDGEQLWGRFVASGVIASDEVDDVVSTMTAESIDDPATRGKLYRVAHTSFGIASQSLLVGAENIGKLALACERCLDSMGDGAIAGEQPLVRLAAATRMLRTAFAQLANPDKSGARVEGLPIETTREELEAILPERDVVGYGGTKAARAAAVIARHTTAGTLATAATAPEATGSGAFVWEPQVDEDMVELFFEEANDRLEALAEKLVELEQRPADSELVRDIFRDLHTVKGSSAMVGLQPFNKLAHSAEDLVGQVREGERAVTGPVVDVLLAALDGLRKMTELAAARQPLAMRLEGLLARLRDPGAEVEPEAQADPEDDPFVPSETPSAESEQGAPRAAKAPMPASRQTIRVDFDKLDLLMNLVGELVLGRDELHTAIRSIGALSTELTAERQLTRRIALSRRTHATNGSNAKDPLETLGDEIGRVERVMVDVSQDLDHASGRLDSISGQLRDQVMKLRMVPIGSTFRKHHRTVRDLANSMGKRVSLELSGEETELDKVLVEMLDEPLMHLIRNAIDHGVETPEQRTAAGKPPEAVAGLRAMHRGNQVVIEISDDGAGIDAGKLRARALEKQVCSAAELGAMDDRQVLELIFRPGFSTAQQVSEVSGRGVGMDVVHSTIVNKLKGQVDISSEVGVGTTITLRLPLTLAIINVILIRAGGEVFAVPLAATLRTLTRRQDEISLVQNREVIAVQDKQVPLISLERVLELPTDPYSAPDTLHVVLVNVGGETYGLACDHLLGRREIVIKSLGALLENVPCAAGATLIGDRCAIILDVSAIIGRALRHPGAPRPVEQKPAGPLSGAEALGAVPHILLVEDSDVVRESLARLLTTGGYKVTTARDGVEGLAAAKAGTFDLVSTDVMMPHMDGYELTRALRALPAYRDAPIIMVTSRGERIDRVRGFDAGVDEYITKPHDRSQLRSVIAKLLASRRKGGET